MGENGSIRDLDFVLWELPVPIAKQFIHVKLRARDVWTVPPSASAAAVVSRAAKLLATPPPPSSWLS